MSESPADKLESQTITDSNSNPRYPMRSRIWTFVIAGSMFLAGMTVQQPARAKPMVLRSDYKRPVTAYLHLLLATVNMPQDDEYREIAEDARAKVYQFRIQDSEQRAACRVIQDIVLKEEN
jgi:hypothetical protein